MVLAVDDVPDPSHRLPERHARPGRIGERAQRDPAPARRERPDQRATDEPAEDRDAALVHGEHGERRGGELGEMLDHEEEVGTDRPPATAHQAAG